MNTTPTQSDDDQHLRLLSIFHYVDGGLTAVIACVPLVHVALGLAMIFSPESMGSKPGDQPPQFIGWMFTCMGAGMFLAFLSLGVCTALAGRFIKCRTRYWFIFVVACLQCSMFPFGTALGVFTIIVLSRPSVKSQFAITPSSTTSA